MTQKEREKREAITVPQTYNNQLKKAIDEKIIEKKEKGRVSFYRAAPF